MSFFFIGCISHCLRREDQRHDLCCLKFETKISEQFFVDLDPDGLCIESFLETFLTFSSVCLATCGVHSMTHTSIRLTSGSISQEGEVEGTGSEEQVCYNAENASGQTSFGGDDSMVERAGTLAERLTVAALRRGSIASSMMLRVSRC